MSTLTSNGGGGGSPAMPPPATGPKQNDGGAPATPPRPPTLVRVLSLAARVLDALVGNDEPLPPAHGQAESPSIEIQLQLRAARIERERERSRSGKPRWRSSIDSGVVTRVPASSDERARPATDAGAAEDAAARSLSRPRRLSVCKAEELEEESFNELQQEAAAVVASAEADWNELRDYAGAGGGQSAQSGRHCASEGGAGAIQQKARRSSGGFLGRRESKVVLPEAEVQPLVVLVADDNKINQKVACAMLRRCGVEAQVCDDGRQAVELATTTRYDVIFMDHDMPEMDGLEATCRIRAYEASIGFTPSYIVALSANEEAEGRPLCMAAGMDDFVQKPLRPDDIGCALRQFYFSRATPGRKFSK